ncbi:Fc.00g108230.m01.CDS01 [Cosmosporella sp. VM-42]
MPKRRRTKAIPKELPACEGPKLRLFQHHDSHIQWLERLGDDEDEDTPTEGYVFRAKIKHREYAIKVFKFYNPLRSEHFWRPLMGDDTPLHTAAYYSDPFYAECRAYGRIHEALKKKELRAAVSAAAIPCHGFFFLQERDEKTLKDRDIDLELDKVDLEYQRASVGGCRARAIVKDLASTDPGVNEKSLMKILRGITTLNRLQIYNMDIRLDNYRDGRIVDFGSSWTEPHGPLNGQHARAALGSRLTDRVMFDDMVRDEEIPNPKKVVAMHRMNLRSRDV